MVSRTSTDGAGASLIALAFGDTVTDISQWKPSFTLPAGIPATVDGDVGWWLHGLSEQPGGAAAISAFDGTAEGDSTETNLMRKSVSDPIVFPSGDWWFFRLKIK